MTREEREERQSIRAEINGLVDMVFRQLGGRGTQDDIKAHLFSLLSPEQHAYLEEPGLTSIIGLYFRHQTKDGLPQAPEVDERGTHCQLELLTVEEHRYVIRKYMERANQNRDKAYSQAKVCSEQHAVWIDPESVLEEDDEDTA